MISDFFMFPKLRLGFVLTFLFIQACSLVGAEVPSVPEDKSKFLIFLLMGQSNMEGHVSVDGDMDKIPNPRVLKLNQWGSWEVAVDPIAYNHEAAVGPGLQFGKTLAEADPDITIGLIPLAVGGTSITQWSKTSLLYFNSINAAAKARQDGTLAGILWHQGEHDTFTSLGSSSYQNRLMTLIDDFRKDVGDPYLPFIIGGLTDSEEELQSNPYRGRVWRSLYRIANTFPGCAYASSVGVPFLANNQIHFSTEGQRILGTNYAHAYLNLVGFWTAKGKEWLDSEAEDNEDGWKYHPDLGVYHDEHWPIIKHAQLGWLKIGIDQNRVIRLDSPFIGKYTVLQNDGLPNAIYIYTEDITQDDVLIYPENTVYGVPFYVDLLREPGDPYCFADHSFEPAAFIDRLPGMTVVEDTWDLNSLVESEYYQTQLSAQSLRVEIASFETSWSYMRKYVDDVVYHRNYTNYIGWEGYYYSDENETGNLRTFWMDKFYERLYYIDDYVIEAQTNYQSATDVLLSE